MSKFCFLILFTILSPGTIKSQLTNNIWYFGTNAGLDFSTSPPTAITSPLITVEGTATICNQAGNLLFYTNGVSIWDRTHTIMPNGEGLIGGLSSTQAAMIVPLPGSISRYYVFTSTEYESDDPTKPLAYSIVDMCLNDGRGDIESGAKNIIFHPDCGEKLTAAKHTNGTDIWILSHEVNSNRLLAFQLTAYGLITTPVATSIGAVA